MRKSADWMVLLDDRCLELLREDEDGLLSPSEIAEDERITYGSNYVGKRLRKLAENGYVQRFGNGVYQITEQGASYLDEEYDAINDVWIEEIEENGGPTAGEGFGST
ncbi:hypothetical protein BRD16_01670 [Halobacteriales archaeon SW_6_65_46]|nr:MAG: hypothetical protein BRD16_01670 [Halobacteriales archaeon SW_6_65_46]